MIDRYASKEMKKIWNEEAKFQAFLDVEIAVLHAWNSLGVIPTEDVEEVEKKASFSVDRMVYRMTSTDPLRWMSPR